MRRNFNPRSRKGSDGCPLGSVYYSSYFNPRSRKGSDDHRRTNTSTPRNFNPRSRKGSDKTGEYREQKVRVFQSTLP